MEQIYFSMYVPGNTIKTNNAKKWSQKRFRILKIWVEVCFIQWSLQESGEKLK